MTFNPIILRLRIFFFFLAFLTYRYYVLFSGFEQHELRGQNEELGEY